MEQRDERTGILELELLNLWTDYEIFRGNNFELELMCCDAVAECWEKKDLNIEIDQLSRASEMMLVVAYAISLAERRSDVIKKKISERQVTMVIVDDTDEGSEKNGFWLGVDMLEDGSLELWLDINVLMSEQCEMEESTLDGLLEVSGQLTNAEFVFLCMHACEEYAHMAFDSYKSEEVLFADIEVGDVIRQMVKSEVSESERNILLHTQGSEYRGGIWKAWFMRTYLPSFRSTWPKIVRSAGKKRREMGIWP